MRKQDYETGLGGSLGTRPLSRWLVMVGVVEGCVLGSDRGRVWDVEKLVLER